jgi:TolB-like protein/DNA-binding winged helix-turn-helix (wHTH) protein/Tfp pilus assembly protein PilF
LGISVATHPSSSFLVRFGDCELDLQTGELCRNGTLLRLQPQPAKVLTMLVGRAGEVVTRQELAKEVWGSADTFVDFEQGLNFAIRQIRSVLGDDAEHPRFLETLPKRGYRFIAPLVRTVAAHAGTSTPATTPPERIRYAVFRNGVAAVAAAIVVTLGLTVLWRHLAAPKSTRASGAIASIAVLPLRNLSRDSDQEYFSDGMTDELITDLAKVGRLRVISHTSVQRYKESKQSLPEIARELGVDAVIEGTVMRSENRVRITAQLIDARTDQHLWAEAYERDFRDILNLQSEVAQEIAGQVGVNLTVVESANLARTSVVDPAAHEDYLRGRFYQDKLSCTGFQEARVYYERAALEDPTFVRAFIETSDVYYTLGDWGCMPQAEAFAKSRAAALKATALDPDSASAYAKLANLDFTAGWNWPKAGQEYLQAIHLDPNDAGVHSSYAIFLVAMGKPEEAIAELKKAQSLDPVSERTNMVSTYVLYFAHQYDQAVDQGKKTLELYPDSRATDYWMGHIYEQKKMPAESFAYYLKSNNAPPAEIAALHAAFAKDGLRGFWLRELEISERKPDWPCWKGIFYAHTGDQERAMQALDQSFDHHCDGLQFLKTNPVFDPLRDNSRYRELISKLKL